MKLVYKIPRGVGVIYAIVNLRNGKKYIGSTVRYRLRYREHRLMLKRGEHHARHLQRSYSKHGKDNFVMIPLEVFSGVDKQTLIDKEQRWVNRYAARQLYNTTTHITPAPVNLARPVFAISPDGAQRIRFASVFDAARVIRPNCQVNGVKFMRRAIYEHQLSKGYYWTYADDDTPRAIRARKRESKLRRKQPDQFSFEFN